MREVNSNTRVLILDHKDNIHTSAIDKTGIVKLIKEDEGIELYYIHLDEYIEDLPPYKALNIPQGYCYIAIKEELAFI